MKKIFKKTFEIFNSFKNKPSGFLTGTKTISSLQEAKGQILPETEKFIKEMCDMFFVEERRILEIKKGWKIFTLEELFLMKYGDKNLRYDPERSLIFALLLMERGCCKFLKSIPIEMGTDEVLDRFGCLFEKK